MEDSQPSQPSTPAPQPGDDKKIQIKNFLSGINKGTLVAAIIAGIALIIGIGALFNYTSSGKYRGFIQKIESQTDQLNKSNPTGIGEIQGTMETSSTATTETEAPVPIETPSTSETPGASETPSPSETPAASELSPASETSSLIPNPEALGEPSGDLDPFAEVPVFEISEPPSTTAPVTR